MDFLHTKRHFISLYWVQRFDEARWGWEIINLLYPEQLYFLDFGPKAVISQWWFRFFWTTAHERVDLRNFENWITIRNVIEKAILKACSVVRSLDCSLAPISWGTRLTMISGKGKLVQTSNKNTNTPYSVRYYKIILTVRKPSNWTLK